MLAPSSIDSSLKSPIFSKIPSFFQHRVPRRREPEQEAKNMLDFVHQDVQQIPEEQPFRARNIVVPSSKRGA
ncbi:hypothetical protein [Methylovirgula sp. HY1]|uniref:hypothetical protein n=1 Tax=Methylovirgula sp. HY1 TaxID=2822761 RepID=UPI001C5BCD44|nr:hypothetical protein [Methylovirgula sp. HY1]